MRKLISFFKDEEGASGVEYTILAALIAAVIVATVAAVGNQTEKLFNKTVSAISSVCS